MLAVSKSFLVLAGTALMAAGPVDLPERHTEMIIRNHTDTDHSLRTPDPLTVLLFGPGCAIL